MRFQRESTNQHGVGLCDGRLVERGFLCSVGESSAATLGRVQSQRTGIRQYGVGVRDGCLVARGFVCSVGEVAERRLSECSFSAQELANTAWLSARAVQPHAALAFATSDLRNVMLCEI